MFGAGTLAVALVYVLSVGAAYEVGLAQFENERIRLHEELAEHEVARESERERVADLSREIRRLKLELVAARDFISTRRRADAACAP